MIDEDLCNLLHCLDLMADDADVQIGWFRCTAKELREVLREARDKREARKLA